jgi:hypothetical protein
VIQDDAGMRRVRQQDGCRAEKCDAKPLHGLPARDWPVV